MKKSISSNGVVLIHITVFLFGFAGLFGKFLSCDPVYIVFGRTFVAFIALFLYVKFVSKSALTLSLNKTTLFFILQGLLLAVHWWSFFLSIQISSVALGLVTFSTFPIFVTFLEPLFFKERLETKNIVLAGIVFIGVILVIPDFNLTNNITKGALFGIFSGLTFAILTLVNRKNTGSSDSITIAFYQNLFACIFLILPIVTIQAKLPLFSDLPNMIFLGVICTALAHTLFIKSLLFLKAHTVSLITCLEPVYGIILAFLIFNATPDIRTIAGGIIIIGVSIAVSIKQFKKSDSKFL